MPTMPMHQRRTVHGCVSESIAARIARYGVESRVQIPKSTSQPLHWRTVDPVNKGGSHAHRHEEYAGGLPAERSAYCQCLVDDARRSPVPSEISWRDALRLNSNSRGIGRD